MLRFVLGCLATLAIFPSGPARADALSAEVGLYSRYLDYDLFALTAEPVIQGGLFLQASEACQILAWGSHGLATSVGGELDVGAYCGTDIAGTTVTVGALRSFLRGLPDATTLSFGLARGGFDLTAEQYFWVKDGTRIYGGYTWQASGRLKVHPMAAYETGLGLTDILAAGASAELELEKGVSLVALGLMPIVKADDDFRSSELMVGMRYRF